MRVSSHTESTRLPARSLAFPPLQQRTELTSRECRLPKTYGSGMQEIGERRARGTKPAPVQSKQAVDDDKRRTVCPYRRRRGGGQKTERSVSASPMRPTPRRKVGETDTTSTRLLLDGGLDQRLQHMPRVRNRKHDPPLLNGLGEKRERRGTIGARAGTERSRLSSTLSMRDRARAVGREEGQKVGSRKCLAAKDSTNS